jgi:isocitrate dehydrogenase (NAD+)
MSAQNTHEVVLIPGDGIGPQIAEATVRILDAAGAPLSFEHHQAGLAALEQGDEVMPQSTVDAIRRTHLALKGPCTTPVGDGFTSVNVQLRQLMDLYSAIRPVRSIEGVPTRYENVDVVVFRENTEGMYSGVENEIVPGVITSLKIVTEKASTRLARRAFEYIRKRGRSKLTVFHKANIMKMTDGLFLRCVEEVQQAEFPEIPFDTQIIDAGCMRLVQDPTNFDVLIMENFYGDVVSDLVAGMVGGLGVVPGANIGDDDAIFEAVHGSAPDIAGQGIANPLALLMSGVMMLNHLDDTRDDARCRDAAEAIKRAYNQCLKEGHKTADLGGTLATQAFADEVIRRL